MEDFNTLLYLNDFSKNVLESLNNEAQFFDSLGSDCVFNKSEFAKIKETVRSSFPEVALSESAKNLSSFMTAIPEIEAFLQPHLNILDNVVTFISNSTKLLKKILTPENCGKFQKSVFTLDIDNLIIDLLCSCVRILCFNEIIPMKEILGYMFIIFTKRGQEFPRYKVLSNILGDKGIDFFRKTIDVKHESIQYLMDTILKTQLKCYLDIYNNGSINKLDVNPDHILTKPNFGSYTSTTLSSASMIYRVYLTLLVCPSLISAETLPLLDQGLYEVTTIPLIGTYSINLYKELEKMMKTYDLSVNMPDTDLQEQLKQTIKERSRTAEASSAKVHADHRSILVSVLSRYSLLLEDSPAILGPRILTILSLLSLSQYEIEWYFYNCKKVTTGGIMSGFKLKNIKSILSTKKTQDTLVFTDDSYMTLLVNYMALRRKLFRYTDLLKEYVRQYLTTTQTEMIDIYIKSAKSRGPYVNVAQAALQVISSPSSEGITSLHCDILRAMYTDNTDNCLFLAAKLYFINIYIDFILDPAKSLEGYTSIRNLDTFYIYIKSSIEGLYVSRGFVNVDSYISMVDALNMISKYPSVLRDKDHVTSLTEDALSVITLCVTKYIEFLYGNRDLMEGYQKNIIRTFGQGASLNPLQTQYAPILSLYSDTLNDYMNPIIIYDTTFNICSILQEQLIQTIKQRMTMLITYKKKDKEYVTPPSLLLEELHSSVNLLSSTSFSSYINTSLIISTVLNDLAFVPSMPMSYMINKIQHISTLPLPPLTDAYIKKIMKLLKETVQSTSDLLFVPSLQTFVSPNRDTEFEMFVAPHELNALITLIGPTGIKIFDMYLLSEIDVYIRKIKDCIAGLSPAINLFKQSTVYMPTPAELTAIQQGFNDFFTNMIGLGIYVCMRKSIQQYCYIQRDNDAPLITTPLNEICSQLLNEDVLTQPKQGKYLFFTEDLHVYMPPSYLSEAYIVNFKFSNEHKGEIWSQLTYLLPLSFKIAPYWNDLQYSSTRSLLTPKINELIAAFVMLFSVFLGPSKEQLHTELNLLMELCSKTLLLIKTDSQNKAYKSIHYNELTVFTYELMNEILPLCGITRGTFPPSLPYALIRQAYGSLNGQTDTKGKLLTEEDDEELFA
ncbi:hypothetical protein WA158_002500 [Blastocystis sp. Blastoise]